MEPKLIGLTGKARSGKDTAADYAAKKWGAQRYAFASPLKKGLRAMLGLDSEHTDGGLKEMPLLRFGNKSPRQMLQTLGTEWGRQLVNDTIWVDLGLYEWEKYRAMGQSLIITDVRFDNEAQAIRDAGGVVCHIIRVDAETVSEHSSEAGVQCLPGDFAIANVGTLQAFYWAADLTFTEIFGDYE